MNKSDYKKSINLKTKQISILQKIINKIAYLQEKKEKTREIINVEKKLNI